MLRIRSPAAWDAIDAEPPAAIVADLVLEDGTGVQLADWVRERHPDLPIFYTSAYTDFELVDEVIRGSDPHNLDTHLL